MKTIVRLAQNVRGFFSGLGRKKASGMSAYDEAFIGYEAFSSTTSAPPTPLAEEQGKSRKEHLGTEWTQEM